MHHVCFHESTCVRTYPRPNTTDVDPKESFFSALDRLVGCDGRGNKGGRRLVRRTGVGLSMHACIRSSSFALERERLIRLEAAPISRCGLGLPKSLHESDYDWSDIKLATLQSIVARSFGPSMPRYKCHTKATLRRYGMRTSYFASHAIHQSKRNFARR